MRETSRNNKGGGGVDQDVNMLVHCVALLLVIVKTCESKGASPAKAYMHKFITIHISCSDHVFGRQSKLRTPDERVPRLCHGNTSEYPMQGITLAKINKINESPDMGNTF